MNFGIQLPGPFRIGISGRGRINVGMSLGPVSVSTGIGGRTHNGAPIVMRTKGTVAQAAAALVQDGWKIQSIDDQIATAAWRTKAVQIRQATPEVIEVIQITSRVKLLLWALVVVAGVTAYELLT